MENNVVKNNKKNWVLIALIVSLIVIVVLLIVMFVGGEDSNQLDNDNMMNGESVLDENEVKDDDGDIAVDVGSSESDDEEIDYTDVNDSQVDSSFDVPPQEELEYIEGQIDGIEVVTPYITFYYPEEWRDGVEVVQIDEETNYTLTFSAKISDNHIELFSIFLGHDSVEGYLLGKLVDDSGDINVIVAMNEINADDWTDEEFATISSMQERVNDMIGQLHDDERFVPV